MKRLATIISRVFDPFIMLAVVFIVLLWHTTAFFPAFVAMVLLPLLFFFIAVKTKFVSNWDVSNRQERPKLFWPLIVIEALFLFVFHLWAMIPILFIMIGFSVITNFWKISGHAMAAALTTGIIISRFGWAWWPVLLIVPLVSWSRVVRRDHTVLQVIAGALYSWILILILT